MRFFQPRPFAATGFSVPTWIVAASWIGLWFLWPDGRTLTAAQPRGVCSTRVRYVCSSSAELSRHRLPTLFVQSAGEARKAQPDEDDAVAALATREVNRPPLLEVAPLARPAPQAPVAAPPSPAAEASYEPVWSKAAGLSAVGGGERQVVFRLSSGLKACGFSPPAVPAELLSMSEKPWEATLYVEVGTDGTPSDVFAEQSTADAKVTAALVRLLHRGHAATGSQGGAGRIKVSCSRQ